MRYGYCTGFATHIKDRIDYDLLRDIKAAGFDYVEFPLMLLASLDEEQFTTLLSFLHGLGLSADAACNMFPAKIRLTGPEASDERIRAYLEPAMERLSALGAKKLVFGSAPARFLPDGVSLEEGIGQIVRLVRALVVPLLEKHDVCLVMEPISGSDDNVLNTLSDGMRVVRGVGHPRVMLLADTVHMIYEREDAEEIKAYAPYLRHVHVCEHLRALPARGYTQALSRLLDALRETGYDQTMSFEPNPYPLEDMASALQLLKRRFA